MPKQPDGYVDTEPGNWRCYLCGHETTFTWVHGHYRCDKCKQLTMGDTEGAERMGQLKDKEKKDGE